MAGGLSKDYRPNGEVTLTRVSDDDLHRAIKVLFGHMHNRDDAWVILEALGITRQQLKDARDAW